MLKDGTERVQMDLTNESVFSDLDRLFADAAVAEELRGKAEQKAKRARRGGPGGKGRPPGTDTPRTKLMVYQVLDLTTRTCWFIAGLGTTERMVDTLNEGGSTLQWFEQDRHGKQQVPRQWFLALNLTKDNEPTIFWEPSERFTKCHFIDNGTQQAGLYRVLYDPAIPGRVAVELAPTGKHFDVEVNPVGIAGEGKYLHLEWEHLRQQADTGKKVITYELSADQILGALEELTGVTMTEAAKQKALANLAPVTMRDDSRYPHWLNSQDWPEQKITPTTPVGQWIPGERAWDACMDPFTDRQLNTQHW